ncbi:MAG: PQQ-binding-like beta-propeller repeat protein [Gemmataceae bacterium]
MRFASVLLSLLVLPFGVQAEDWPGWLGPRRDGSSAEKVAQWKAAPKTAWKQPVGEGHSSPIIADGKVYLHTRVQGKQAEQIEAFDAVKGDRLWKVEYEISNFKSPFGNGPRGTPMIAGGKLYSFGITGVLTCIDLAEGKLAWKVDTLAENKAKNLFFGASCSPIVEGKHAIVNVGAKGASIVAYDAASGKSAWQSLDDAASYSSPIAVGSGEGRQVIFLTGSHLVGLSPADGKLLWKYAFKDFLSESSTTPVVADGILFGSSITIGGVGLKLTSNDMKPDVKKEWTNDLLNCYFATPVAVGKHLFMVTGTKPPALKTSATLRCVEAATGKELWNRPNVGTYHASLLRLADNRLLLLEEKGNLALIESDSKEYRELARAKICGNTWAHPALANGRLYVRDNKELVCVQFGE